MNIRKVGKEITSTFKTPKAAAPLKLVNINTPVKVAKVTKKGEYIKVLFTDGHIITLSTSNGKMTQTLIWNLFPVKTCIGCTALCVKNCYALKPHKMKRVGPINCRQNNTDMSIKNVQLYTVEGIAAVLKRYPKYEYFRIHEAGDFYSQEYLEAFFTIAARFPKVSFLAFTKSYQLDYAAAPGNLKLIYSVWADTTTIIDTMPISFAGDCSTNEIVKANKVLKNRIKSSLQCPGQCDDCRACWYLNGVDVHFDIH